MLNYEEFSLIGWLINVKNYKPTDICKLSGDAIDLLMIDYLEYYERSYAEGAKEFNNKHGIKPMSEDEYERVFGT